MDYYQFTLDDLKLQKEIGIQAGRTAFKDPGASAPIL